MSDTLNALDGLEIVRVDSDERPRYTLLACAGALDARTCDGLTEDVTAALESGSRCVQVDLSRVGEPDGAGIVALLMAWRQCEVAGATFFLRPLSPEVRRKLEFVGITQADLEIRTVREGGGGAMSIAETACLGAPQECCVRESVVPVLSGMNDPLNLAAAGVLAYPGVCVSCGRLRVCVLAPKGAPIPGKWAQVVLDAWGECWLPLAQRKLRSLRDEEVAA